MLKFCAKGFEIPSKYLKFIKYCLIGISGATLDFLLYTFLVKYFTMHYLIANAISVTVGITNNFFLNAFFNFKITDRLFVRFLSFYSVGILGLVISEVLLFVFIENIGLNSIISKLVTIFIITLIQFFLNKTFTFKNRENTDG